MNKDTTSVEDTYNLPSMELNHVVWIRKVDHDILCEKAHTAGEAAMLERVMEGVPRKMGKCNETGEPDMITQYVDGFNIVVSKILSHLNTLQKEIEGNKETT